MSGVRKNNGGKGHLSIDKSEIIFRIGAKWFKEQHGLVILGDCRGELILELKDKRGA